MWQTATGLTRVPDVSRLPALPDPIEAPEAVVEMPLPASAHTFYLGGLFVLAVLAACYVAGEILLPVVLAFVLKLLLQPAMRLLEAVRLPRLPAALVTIGALFGLLAGLGTALSGPAADWAGKLPHSVSRIEQRLSLVKRPMDILLGFTRQADSLMGSPATAGTASVEVKGPGLADSLFTGTRNLATGVFSTSLLLFFLLVSGDKFLRRFVEIMPRFHDKRRAVEISQHVECDISAYLITITGMNAAVGVATGVAMYLCGLDDPVLWGAVAFLLNFVPILGPFVGVGVFLLAGLSSFEQLWQVLLPAGLYLLIHLVEAAAVTPILVARRFTLNPVLIVLALLFWHWMWGVPGAILAVPMLAIAKIICDRIRPLMALGHFLGA